MQFATLARPLMLFAATTLASTATLRAQTPPPAAFDAVAEARKVVEDLKAERYAAIEARFSPEMAQALPVGQLKTAWMQLLTQVGAFQSVADPRIERPGGVTVVVFPATYEKSKINLIVAWDASNKLAGLLAQPAT